MKYLVPLDNIADVDFVEQILEILRFFLMGLFPHNKRHSAICEVLLPCVMPVTVVCVIELAERQRIHPYFIASATEFCQYI